MMQVRTELIDKSNFETNGKVKKVPVTIECENNSIYIMPEGYGDAASNDGHGCPLLLEIWEGELRVVAWSDITKEDPNHVISLEGAKESKRKKDDVVEMSLNELDRLRRQRLDAIWEDFDLGLDPDTQEFADSDGWETIQPGNKYWRNFYYYNNPEGDGPSVKATFTVQFKEGSTEIESAAPNYD